MQALSSLFESYALPKKSRLSERSLVIKDLYALYISPQENIHRKKENWKRYVMWLKENRFKNTKENQVLFMKHKLFITVMPIKRFCFFISHIPTQDLYYTLSVGKDKIARQDSFSKFLFGSIKAK
jgi:hypothetical protein